MFGYLLVCLLIVPQVFADVECELKWFKCKNSRTNLNCKTDENPGWIKTYNVCNGARDCEDGSDEFMSECKVHPSWSGRSHKYFYCASGGVIASSKECDGIIDCWDESDELALKCSDSLEVQHGSCSESEFECLPGECISKAKLCDHTIDCSNGKDESLKQCFKECDSDQLQCGYGSCIDSTQICDNHIDCLDGADELPNICNQVKGYTPINYGNCREPKHIKNLYFGDETKYRLDKNDIKYIMPNEPAHFKCSHWTNMEGKSWNVCQLNGTWHHELPQCINKYNIRRRH